MLFLSNPIRMVYKDSVGYTAIVVGVLEYPQDEKPCAHGIVARLAIRLVLKFPVFGYKKLTLMLYVMY